MSSLESFCRRARGYANAAFSRYHITALEVANKFLVPAYSAITGAEAALKAIRADNAHSSLRPKADRKYGNSDMRFIEHCLLENGGEFAQIMSEYDSL